MLPSELYAISQQARCEGDQECHWCGAPCRGVFLHDEPPRLTGSRGGSMARKPGCSYICVGCWSFRRKSVTVNFLSGGYRDRQRMWEWSLFVEGGVLSDGRASAECWGVRPGEKEDACALYEKLLLPPLKFALALLDGEGLTSHIQLWEVNDNPEVKADTPLNFTLNNIPHAYTVYDLKIALRSLAAGGPVAGVSPGTAALVRVLGEFPIPEKERKRGRPAIEDSSERQVTKVITASGSGSFLPQAKL